MNSTIKPYLIIPNLIVQPTWGGDYIAKFKNLSHSVIDGKKIGQSYELYENTNLSTKTSSKKTPSFEIGNAETPQQTKVFEEIKPLNIKDLISINPAAVLGRKSIKVHGEKMGVLIKFTQAKGNSYQLHVKEDNVKWRTKPESWYYFEPGCVTLGVKPGISWDNYQADCHIINDLATFLSYGIKKGNIPVEEARNQLSQKITEINIAQYVNYLEIAKNQAIDLSPCGVHHSWEEDEEKYTQGNILYEVQKNTFDPVSTIRNFDKGKINSDGSIRPLQIGDYFKYVDRSKTANDPSTYLKKIEVVDSGKNYSIQQIFTNRNYQTQKIEYSDTLETPHTKTFDTFHHLFAKEGDFVLSANSVEIEVTKGHAVFIPANTGQYKLSTSNSTTILKTFV